MRKYIVLILVFITLKNGFADPELRCVEVLTNGDISLSWIAPNDPLSQFDSYHIFYSTSVSGPFTEIDSVFNYNQTSYTHAGANGQAQKGHYYVKTRYNISGNLSYGIPSDTLSSMFLVISNTGGTSATLNWNELHNPLPAGYGGYYYIYRENINGVWQCIDSTMSNTFNQQLNLCGVTLRYQIRYNNTSNCISVSSIASNTFSDQTPPDIPKLDSVSVDNIALSAQLGWQVSNAPDVSGYIVYRLNFGNWMPIDTVQTTYYLDVNSNPEVVSESYRIASIDTCNNTSPMGAIHRTILLSTSKSVCEKKVNLSWTKYVNMDPPISGYRILIGIDGGTMNTVATVLPQDTTYTYIVQQTTGTVTCCIRVVAVSQDSTIFSSSNESCQTLIFPLQPQFAYIKYASVLNGKVSLALYNDITVNANGYSIERSTDGGINFSEIAYVNAGVSANTIYIDETADVLSGPYSYRFSVLDSCNNQSIFSDTATTIFLEGENLGEMFSTLLKWTEYQGWDEGIQSYKLYRKNSNVSNPVLVSTLLPGTINFVDHLPNETALGNGTVIYYIEAEQQAGNPLGFQEKSRSNEITLIQPPKVYISNAFTPLGYNKVFKPYMIFVEQKSYDFSIYDRWGKQMFQTSNTNDGWNGSLDGKLVPPDTYIYIIQVTFSDGTPFRKSGNVTVVY